MGLFGRAKSLLGGSSNLASGRSQYYRVACPAGHVLDGTRSEGYQALRCDHCGEAVFILPRSPLPEPAAPRSADRAPVRFAPGSDEDINFDPLPPAPSRPRPSPAAEPDADAQIEWVDEEDVTEDAPEQAVTPKLVPYRVEDSMAEAGRAVPANASPAQPRVKPRVKAAEPQATARSVPAGMIEVEEAPSLKERIVRNKNALIFTGVGLLVVATIAMRLHQGRLATLPSVVERGRTEGLAKLDLGEFQVAKQILAEAAEAVDALGGRVDGADDIRQGAKEAALFADRVGDRLENLLEGASRAESESAWTSKFNTFYKGQAVIFEATIIAIPDSNKPNSAYQIDYEVFYGGAIAPAGKGKIDLAGFRLFELEKPKVGEIKTFGARLSGMTFDSASGTWLFQLASDSGCFITHTRALEAIGWPTADAEESP